MHGDGKGVFKNPSISRHYNFVQVCPKVSILEHENFKFKDIVSLNVSAHLWIQNTVYFDATISALQEQCVGR